jgi:ribosomal protein S18 acetylase RimI-like enzyme
MIDYRDARPEDAPALAAMARRCFCDTFAHLYAQADLDAFFGDAFGAGGLPAQIGHPDYRIRLALDGGDIAGFAKMGPCTLPAPARPDDAELKQLYVLAAYQGAGISKALMQWVIDSARASGAERLVLGVFTDNHRAKRFYARYGLSEIGYAPFPVGTQIDDDRIWMMPL